jgi:DNA polymerase
MLFIDFETRSRCDIRSSGGHRYVADPSTELLCAVAMMTVLGGVGREVEAVWVWSPWGADLTPTHRQKLAAVIDEEVQALRRTGQRNVCVELHFGSDDPPAALLESVPHRSLVAHNAEGFDRCVWEAMGWPAPLEWLDTLPRARRRGLPGHLEQIATQLYGHGKDKAGQKVMMLLCQPQSKRGRGGVQSAPEFLDPDPERLISLIRYCARDVALLVQMWNDENLGKPDPDDECLELDGVINRRGVAVDTELLHRLQLADAALAADATGAAAEVVGLAPELVHAIVSSPARLRVWLHEHGCPVWDVKSDTLRAVAPPAEHAAKVKAMLRARSETARVTEGKLARLSHYIEPDGRIRGILAYWGAHTGRWAGRGPQPQNLPRAMKGVDSAALADAILARSLADTKRDPSEPIVTVANKVGASPAAVLGTLLRSVIVPSPGHRFLIADFSQIEARVLLWLAGDDAGLNVYRQGGDPYRVAAAPLFGVTPAEVDSSQRQVGKVAVLGCGYGAGQKALGRYAAKMNITLGENGLPSAARVVEAWRDARPLVAGERTGSMFQARDEEGEPDGEPIAVRRGGLWRELMAQVRTCVETCDWVGGDTPIQWHLETTPVEMRHLVCTLPSGRHVIYRDARVEDVLKHGKVRQCVTYHSPRGGRRVLYGGKLAENVVQAICRDLLVAAMLRLEAAGYRVVMHVHDEIVAEVPAHACDAPTRARCSDDDVARAQDLLETTPLWAPDLPIGVDCGTAERYE